MQSTKFRKTAALILLAALLCSLFSGCSEERAQPEDTIDRLQNAVNNFDVDSFLQCIESEQAKQIESILALTAGETGLSAGTFFALVKAIAPILPVVSNGTLTSDDLPNVEFTILRTDILDSTAVVILSGILTWGGCTQPFAATVDMKLENDVWVVCGVS